VPTMQKYKKIAGSMFLFLMLPISAFAGGLVEYTDTSHTAITFNCPTNDFVSRYLYATDDFPIEQYNCQDVVNANLVSADRYVFVHSGLYECAQGPAIIKSECVNNHAVGIPYTATSNGSEWLGAMFSSGDIIISGLFDLGINLSLIFVGVIVLFVAVFLFKKGLAWIYPNTYTRKHLHFARIESAQYQQSHCPTK